MKPTQILRVGFAPLLEVIQRSFRLGPAPHRRPPQHRCFQKGPLPHRPLPPWRSSRRSPPPFSAAKLPHCIGKSPAVPPACPSTRALGPYRAPAANGSARAIPPPIPCTPPGLAADSVWFR